MKARNYHPLIVKVQRLEYVALSVRDVEKSAAWYSQVLGLNWKYQEEWGTRPALMAAGGSGIALWPAKHKLGGKIERIRPSRLAFSILPSDLSLARHRLKKNRITFKQRERAPTVSVTFQDPDGHQITLTSVTSTFKIPKR